VLDQVAEIDVSEQLWNSVPSRAKLPFDAEEFFAARGVAGAHYETRRQFHRMHMRETGILLRGVDRHGIYTKDVSPMGVGFLSPVQVFPCERIRLLLHDQTKLDLELRRCRRIEVDCYECGAVFVDGVIPPPVYKRLIQSQRRRH
jgi:PilZ domain